MQSKHLNFLEVTKTGIKYFISKTGLCFSSKESFYLYNRFGKNVVVPFSTFKVLKRRSGKRNKDGKVYQNYGINGKVYLVHRIVAYAFLGLNILDSSLSVCHKDDNPENNSIDNLFVSDAKGNGQDMAKKFRALKKLNKQDVINICRLHTEGMSMRHIHRSFYKNKISFTNLRKHCLQRHLHGFPKISVK